MIRETLITAPAPAGPTSQRDSETRQRGLSKATVDAIYDAVLSGDTNSRTPKGQFSKGSSGNPRGRPKQAPSSVTPLSELEPESLGAIALRHAATKMKAQMGDGEVEITLKEATVARMAREAVKGNTGHARTFAQIVSRAEVEEARRKRDAFRHWSDVKSHAAELYAQAEAAGDEPPLFVHPDDIELDADGNVAIVGPTKPGDIAVMRYTYSKVEYHLVHVAYYKWIEKRCIRRYGGRLTDGILYAELDFWCEQHELPPRLQMTLEDVAARLNTYARMSGRTLHSLLRKEADRHGFYAPPRELRVPIVVPKEALEIARTNGVSAEQFLTAWLEASAVAWNQRATSDAAVKLGS